MASLITKDTENITKNETYHLMRNKLLNLVDDNSFEELYGDLISGDPLEFENYPSKLKNAQNKTGELEAVIVGKATIQHHPVIVFSLDPNFIMGSLSSVCGEKITRAFELATKKKIPVISIVASGGARMQEGVFSLMQMAKTSAAVAKHRQKKQLYISVITDPTLGGVTASFASLGNIIIAVENARFGFTGKRIVEETINRTLPDTFQRAVFAKEHGQVDIVAKENDLPDLLRRLVSIHCRKVKI